MNRLVLHAAILGLLLTSEAAVSPVAVALGSFSWEDGTAQGWDGSQDGLMFGDDAILTAKTVSDGIPAAAITDGMFALEIAHPNNGKWSQVARAHGGFEPDFTDPAFSIHDELIANTTIELDLYIPQSTVPSDEDIMFDPVNNPNNKWYQFEISIEGLNAIGGLSMNFTKKFTQDGFDFLPGATQDLPTDTSIHIVYEYAAKPQWDPTSVATQITINTQNGDQFDELDDSNFPNSPWYIDNFKFTGGATPGDFDEDDDVDGADFLEWQRDNSVGVLADWQSNYGTSAGLTGFSAVPEPTSLGLLFAAVGLLTGARRRQVRL